MYFSECIFLGPICSAFCCHQNLEFYWVNLGDKNDDFDDADVTTSRVFLLQGEAPLKIVKHASGCQMKFRGPARSDRRKGLLWYFG